ncbi:hypothetical protein ACIHEI_22980 [Kitasatospora sp. NPDC051984]|uniref:hypothetical protein n=1 Tax=Kitasatospora sp. NPDC051984 TaxID=3364059 RepID=UPI0037C89B01
MDRRAARPRLPPRPPRTPRRHRPGLRRRDLPPDELRSRLRNGTLDAATVLTLPAALDFHHALGAAPAKQARLRHLRDRWVAPARTLGNVQILTPDDPAMYGAITSFRIAGRTSPADNEALARYLMDRHRIFTVRRGGPTGGDCVRVTPALFTRAADIDRFTAALQDAARVFINLRP